MESLCFRQLVKPIVTSSHGRISKSNDWSPFVPHFSHLKAEYEFEGALLLIESIEQKGLTAAALSDWKRRQTASSITQVSLISSLKAAVMHSQVLRDTSSPLDLFSLTDTLDQADPSAAGNGCHQMNQVDHRIRDLGKPLICTHLKPYMALS